MDGKNPKIAKKKFSKFVNQANADLKLPRGEKNQPTLGSLRNPLYDN